MSSSTRSLLTPETPSPSSPVKPLPLREPAEALWQDLEALLSVLQDERHREALEALTAVLRAEQAYHLQAAAFSNDAEKRGEHRGVVRWLDEWLSGATAARYAVQVREKLNLNRGVEIPVDGTPWMEGDGLEEGTKV